MNNTKIEQLKENRANKDDAKKKGLLYVFVMQE